MTASAVMGSGEAAGTFARDPRAAVAAEWEAPRSLGGALEANNKPLEDGR